MNSKYVKEQLKNYWIKLILNYLFFYLIDIEKIYNEYKKISDCSKTDDEFIYNEITQNLEKEHIVMIENE